MITVDIVILKGSKILLVKRGSEPFKGKYALPGGFLEDHETLSEAAERELKEETGIEVKDLERIGIYDDPGRDPRGRVVSVAFMGRTEQEPKAGSDAEEVKWFHKDDLPDLAFDHNIIVGDALYKNF